eukprot:TRINITY_DN66407_c10_g1_i1.p1 TRINITY_DN66407_c10_g1~~TRINITY_DN66407_c10_g1_i1.p1  ORF type:complete len:319 (-),score=50.41 TRINITY_DN66407_c10_g1_i1:230-1186(-)
MEDNCLGSSILEEFTKMVTLLNDLSTVVNKQSSNFQQFYQYVQGKAAKSPDDTKTIENNENDVGSTIRLNVGGVSFVTTKTTLLKEKENFLSSLVQDNWQPDFNNNTEYFIDRSPDSFKLVLDYLRSEDPLHQIDGLSTREHTLLAAEADFFQIESLKSALALLSSSTNSEPAQLQWDDQFVVDDNNKKYLSFTHNCTVVHMEKTRVWAKPPPKDSPAVKKFRFVVKTSTPNTTVKFGFGFCVGAAGSCVEWEEKGYNGWMDCEYCPDQMKLQVSTAKKVCHLQLQPLAPQLHQYPFDVPLPRVSSDSLCCVAIMGLR